jgi:alkylation response protein AidB-like acyl-CoA dehydrogenase
MATRDSDLAATRQDTERRLVALAREMIPALRARAAETEDLRRIPDATEQQFRAASFYRTLQPKAFGGHELDYGAHTLIAMELARGCVSSAWAYSVTACHSWILGMFPAQCQEEVWGANPDAAIASSFLPVAAKMQRVESGFHVSGRWRFSSNVLHCQACILLVTEARPDGPPKQYFALITRDQYDVEETWNTIGLAGSGSNDVLVKETFIPEHRLLELVPTRDAVSPGGKHHSDSDLFNMPLFAPFAHSLVGPAVGGAQAALDIVLEELVDRRSVAQVQLSQQQSVQMRIAEATAEIEAARAVLAVDRQKILDGARRRETPDYEQRVKYRLNAGYAAKLAVQAVERLLPLTGGRGLERTHPLQRAWRDVHAVAQHIALVWDLQTLNYGAVRLGHNALDPRI